MQWQDIKPLLYTLPSSIKYLNLQNSLLDDTFVSQLIDLLQTSSLVQLDIRNTKITKAGAQQLFDATEKLKRNIIIQHETMPEILTHFKKATPQPQIPLFNLQALLNAFKDPKFTVLDLSQYKIYDTAKKSIRALEWSDIQPLFAQLPAILQDINLQNTALTDVDIAALILAFKMMPGKLELLDIRNTKISKDGVQRLYENCKTLNLSLVIRHESMAEIMAASKPQPIIGSPKPAVVLPKPPVVSPKPTPAPVIDKKDDQPDQKNVSPKKPGNPINDMSVSFVINYSELKIGKELGRGGFGVVYQGTWRFDDVAIKQLLVSNPTPACVDEFKSETQVMAKLHSPHIVQFYGCCIGNPQYCIVMEYMPKGSLFSVLHNKESLDWSKRYQMASDIAHGLAFLHASSIQHRDLKSLNVLLDENYRAKLTDFGLSKIKTETKTTTKTSQKTGTFGWMAPELTKPRAAYMQKCDMFSMGVTFWEIAARKIPYEDAHERTLIPMWLAQGDREDIPADCPPKFAHLIKWCWDTDPAKRPTAAEAVKYLRDNENDFKAFDQNSAAAPDVNANAAANSFAVSMKGNTTF